jgi:hypothetical protein
MQELSVERYLNAAYRLSYVNITMQMSHQSNNNVVNELIAIIY